jgi:integrase
MREIDMPTITEHKNQDGTRSFTAQVRVKPFKPSSKTVHERDFPSRKEARTAAERWAEQLEEQLRQQRVRGAVRSDVAALKFSELVKEYLADPRTKALCTYSERERQMGWWVEHYGALRALEFPSPTIIRDGRERLLRKHPSGSTANRYLSAARACVNFARGSGLLPPNVVWPPRLMLTEAKHRERFLTDEELQRALDAARAHSSLMYAAVMFAIGVGCRQGELLRVRWGDIDEASATVAIRVSKTDTSRRAHLPPAVLQALKEWRGEKVRPLPSRLVFAHPDGKPIENYLVIARWIKIRTSAGLPDLRFHDLRHASASFLIQGGATLAEVAHQLGHKHVATSKRYAHLVAGAKPTGADKLNEKLGGGTAAAKQS